MPTPHLYHPTHLGSFPSLLFIVVIPLQIHRSEEHTSELQSPCNLVCRLLLEKKKTVLVALQGANTEELESQITKPVTDALDGVACVDEIRAMSHQVSALFTITLIQYLNDDAS